MPCCPCSPMSRRNTSASARTARTSRTPTGIEVKREDARSLSSRLPAMESQKKYPPTFSFEFFPPKTQEGMEKLRATWRQLIQLKPRFFSVTYGAGGPTRERTLEAGVGI